MLTPSTLTSAMRNWSGSLRTIQSTCAGGAPPGWTIWLETTVLSALSDRDPVTLTVSPEYSLKRIE